MRSLGGDGLMAVSVLAGVSAVDSHATHLTLQEPQVKWNKSGLLKNVIPVDFFRFEVWRHATGRAVKCVVVPQFGIVIRFP